MDKERVFKEHTFLTDGKTIIYICYVFKRDWTPQNNYGSKNTNYWNCNWYPRNGSYSGETLITNEYRRNNIPGLWFQEGHHLDKFHKIDKCLISEKVLNILESPTIKD